MILFIAGHWVSFLVFFSAGMICVYLSNDQMSNALNKYDSIVNYNLDDLTTYASNVVKVGLEPHVVQK